MAPPGNISPEVQLSRPVLLYDGDCRLCRFVARVVASTDPRGRVALLPLSDEAAATLVSVLPEAERYRSWHLVRPGGAISSRGLAGAELLDALGHARVGRIARAQPLVERAYAFVAGNRDWLGKLVPDGPAPRRFP
jgi:predicted DCC family thiol-disulfide oxidoreductase YuxK